MSLFDELPPEIVERILDNVKMGGIVSPVSSVGNLHKCQSCRIQNIKCTHMSIEELGQIRRLMNVCKLWYELLKAKQYEIHRNVLEFF